MNSIAFPVMLNTTSTKLTYDHEATLQNIRLVLLSERGELFGDPYFGCLLKRFIYQQSDEILANLIVDSIYTTIVTFIPQVKLTRKNISVKTDGYNVFTTISCINILDYTNDMFTIQLTNE